MAWRSPSVQDHRGSSGRSSSASKARGFRYHDGRFEAISMEASPACRRSLSRSCGPTLDRPGRWLVPHRRRQATLWFATRPLLAAPPVRTFGAWSARAAISSNRQPGLSKRSDGWRLVAYWLPKGWRRVKCGAPWRLDPARSVQRDRRGVASGYDARAPGNGRAGRSSQPCMRATAIADVGARQHAVSAHLEPRRRVAIGYFGLNFAAGERLLISAGGTAGDGAPTPRSVSFAPV
jgi:hypothetical protein